MLVVVIILNFFSLSRLLLPMKQRIYENIFEPISSEFQKSPSRYEASLLYSQLTEISLLYFQLTNRHRSFHFNDFFDFTFKNIKGEKFRRMA